MPATKRKRSRVWRGRLGKWAGNRTLAELSKLFGISVPYASHLLHGRARPSVDTAARIERATGGAVPAASWGR